MESSSGGGEGGGVRSISDTSESLRLLFFRFWKASNVLDGLFLPVELDFSLGFLGLGLGLSGDTAIRSADELRTAAPPSPNSSDPDPGGATGVPSWVLAVSSSSPPLVKAEEPPSAAVRVRR